MEETISGVLEFQALLEVAFEVCFVPLHDKCENRRLGVCLMLPACGARMAGIGADERKSGMTYAAAQAYVGSQRALANIL
jgi:hypothetical protein